MMKKKMKDLVGSNVVVTMSKFVIYVTTTVVVLYDVLLLVEIIEPIGLVPAVAMAFLACSSFVLGYNRLAQAGVVILFAVVLVLGCNCSSLPAEAEEVPVAIEYDVESELREALFNTAKPGGLEDFFYAIEYLDSNEPGRPEVFIDATESEWLEELVKDNQERLEEHFRESANRYLEQLEWNKIFLEDELFLGE